MGHPQYREVRNQERKGWATRPDGRHLATYAGGTSGTTYFVHTDWLGNERMRTQPNGTEYSRWTNLPFGEGSSSSNGSPLHFTGKERDAESGLDDYDARYYTSTMGRFISPDWSAQAEPVPYAKLENPQSLNLYTYVLNDPLGSLDLDGHNIDCSGSHVGGAGCAAIADWNRVHEVSAAVWAANNFDGYGGAPQQNSNNATQTGTTGQAQSHFASVSYWPKGAKGFGHIGIGVDSDDTQGFSTSDPSIPWYKRLFGAPPARTEFDIPQHTRNGDVALHHNLHILVSAAQAKAMLAVIADRTANPGRYNLLFRNCTGFVESVLHAGGVSGVPHGEIFGPPVLGAILWYVNTWR